MPHDGQSQNFDDPVVMTSLITLTKAALEPVGLLLERATETVRALTSDDGKIKNTLVEQHQTATHGLAWLATYAQALQQMQKWAEHLERENRFGEVEQLIHQIAFGEYLWQMYGGLQMNQGEMLRLQDLGLDQEDMRVLMTSKVMALTQNGNTQAARSRLVSLMQEQSANITVGGIRAR